MSNPKVNNLLRKVQGLAVLICILFMILAAAPAEARYRAEKDVAIQFQVWEPAQIYLGTLSGLPTGTEEESSAEASDDTVPDSAEEAIFHPEGVLTWTELAGKYSMELAVANGSSAEDFYEKDQEFRLQLIGSLGLGTEEEFPEIELRVPTAESPESYETFQGVATRIQDGTVLYHSVGSGWIVRFQDEEGLEPTWILKGGALSYKRLIVDVQGAWTDNAVLLRPQVASSVIQK